MNWKTLLKPGWHAGQLLAFSGLDGATSYADGLVGRTRLDPAGLFIKDPEGAGVIFGDAPEGEIFFGGDHFRFRTATGEVSGALLDAWHLLITGPCQVTLTGPALQFVQREGRTLIGVASHFQEALLHSDPQAAFAARHQWLSRQRTPDNLTPERERSLGRALTMMKGQVYAPEGVIRSRWTTPDRWPHKDMWLWDSAFHAIGWRHFDVPLAREMIDAVFDVQQPDGLVPHRLSPAGPLSDFTQPPVLALGVKLVQEKEADLAWLEKLYPKLAAYLEWDFQHRDSDGGGLLEWFIEGDPHCRSGESGMDNSPRFDQATALDAVDFNAFLAHECEWMAEFATQLGRKDEAARWAARHAKLCSLINTRLWSEKENFYCDYDPALKQLSPVLSSAGFLPLLCGAASPEQARALARHLSDPDMFATGFPVPSIAVRDWKSYAKDMWRGPTWINMNWLIARGLSRYGLHDHAQALRDITLQEIERLCEKYGTFFEYFDDRREIDPPQLLRKGICAPELNPYRQVIHEFGWTATLYVDLVMEPARTA